MSSSPSGLFFAGKVLGEEVDLMSSSTSCLFLLEVFLSLCLGEEVDLMSSSPPCLFFCWKCSWGGGRLNVVLPILPVFAGGNFQARGIVLGFI